MEVTDQLHAPAALSRRKETPISTEREVGWASEAVWTRSFNS